MSGEDNVQRGSERHDAAVRLFVEALRKAKWKVRREPDSADLELIRGDAHYIAELKFGPEPRPDRLVCLLAAAILEAQAAAGKAHALPLALLASPVLRPAIVEALFTYADRVAPAVAVGLLDLDGRIQLNRPEFVDLNHNRPPSLVSRIVDPAIRQQPFDPFSDSSQWLLKVLLSDRLPDELLNAPRRKFASGAELAKAARVSPPSVSRLLNHLRNRGLLSESAPVRLARVEELLRQWQAAYVRPARELKMRWLIPGGKEQLGRELRAYRASRSNHRAQGNDATAPPRACLALFSAARALGYRHVIGVPEFLYLERADGHALESMGLVPVRSGERVEVVVRIPFWPRSLFRGAVERDGVLVSDILQVWLDVSENPARGREQADEIWQKVLRPKLGLREEGYD
jgi:hypothetical protein